MGLSGPKKRVKLSHDPNNTQWTSNVDSFGHKLMKSQGWTPGQYLGAVDAPHSEYHTAANASHIRVALKDDTLGLGAKKGSGLDEGQCTGLDVFQTLLGRLNGKDEDILAKEEKSRAELKMAIYGERKWGSMRFVKGGLLIGDKIEKLIEDEGVRLKQLAMASVVVKTEEASSGDEDRVVVKVVKPKKPKSERSKDREMVKIESEGEESGLQGERRSKKRKIVTPSGSEPAAEAVLVVEHKHPKRRKHLEDDQSDTQTMDDTDPTRSKDEAKKSKKKISKNDTSAPTSTNVIIEPEKPLSKEERRARRKERKAKAEAEGVTTITIPAAVVTVPSISTSTPASQPATPQSLAGGRHAVRSRNIAQKRLAVMDMAALNQACSQDIIFMIKS